MKIGIELRWVTAGRAAGLAALLEGVLHALFRDHPEHDYVVFCTPFNRGLLRGHPPAVRVLTLPPATFFDEVDRVAGDGGCDVLFRSSPLEHKFAFPLCRQVVLVPDLRHEVSPDEFGPDVLRSLRRACTQALRGAGAVGAISEFVRDTLRRHEDTQCPDLFLLPPALPAPFRDAAAQPLRPEEKALVPAEDFFLYPAGLWPYKNHDRVVEAFELFVRQSGRRMALVLTGPPDGWRAWRAAHPAAPVRHLGFVSAALLRRLYERARALVHFSRYESIGLPLLEAFDAGTPVLCSEGTCLPEIGGDAVLCCDPLDVGAMAALMTRVAGDEALRADLVTRGRQRLRRFDWAESARNLHAACRRVASIPTGRRLSAALASARLPLVSIVTPSYNQGRFLHRTIDSVLGQTYPHVEYLVMDGGSTDDSVDILRSYADRFAWVSERDGGQTAAINKGFARSHGAIRAYLNSDDVLLPYAVDRAVTHFLRNPDCDLLYGGASYIDADDRVLRPYPTADYSFPRLVHDCCICQPATFWRTRIAERVGPFDERLHYAMDFDYWLRVDRAGGRIEHVRDILAYSREYAETKTLSARRQIYREIFDVCGRHAGYVDANYFYGLWHHLCEECDWGLPRWLVARPGLHRTLAYWHHKWWHRHQYGLRGALAAAGRYFRHQLRRAAQPLRPVAGPLRQFYLDAVKARRAPAFGPDNWLGPVCTVPLRPAPGHVWHLAGTPFADMALTIKAAGRLVGRYRLRGGESVCIAFTVPAAAGTALTLAFSACRPGHGRRVSFLVEDTNLLCEGDMAAAGSVRTQAA
jgi:glycosyltransferase involved in cell wall biosynthesis